MKNAIQFGLTLAMAWLLPHSLAFSQGKEWPDKVKGIYDNLLKDLDLEAKDLPLLAGELVSADAGGACAGMNRIIDEFPRTIPTAYVVSPIGCSGKPDHLHFDGAGYRELGKHYAETMLPLLGSPQTGNH